MAFRHTLILGVRVTSLTYKKTLKVIDNWINKNIKSYICVTNVHLVMKCQKDPKLRIGINSAGLVTPDGMPLVWLSNLYGRKTDRVYGPTLLDKVCRLSEKRGYKVFFLGGIKGVSKNLLKKISIKYPKLKVVGYQETPVRPILNKDNQGIIKKINTSGSKIVFVGLGSPYQEYWMINNRNQLNPNVLIGVGAAFDFVSGRIRQAPAWMQEIGFEWLFRFVREPKRLWYRYTITNLLFIHKIFSQLTSDFLKNR